nr:putative phage abortive infection protein [Bacteroides thetaiotaomicron]
MASEFNSPQKYSKIFRAQLSKYELALLFFNSFSSLSTSKTRELYLNADLFNNLELRDVRLKEGAYDESVSRIEYINFPPIISQTVVKNEYISRNLLIKMYDSVQIKK